MFVDPHLLKTATGPLKKSNVKYIIVNEDCIFTEGGEIEAFKEANPQFTVITYKDLIARGKAAPVEPRLPKPEDVFAIMYTSGTSGDPKGVCVRHESLVAGGMSSFRCLYVKRRREKKLLTNQYVSDRFVPQC